VDPQYCRSGLGRRLLEWLEASAVVAGISVVYLEVRATNQGAQAFYERCGYQKIARARGYYGGYEAAIRMARDLWCARP
jgi:ribosomal protein S18 acetylase RimI-like enzyme